MAKTPSKPAANSVKTPAKAVSKPIPETKPTSAAMPAPSAHKPILRTTGLSPREQKLQAMLEKAAHKSSGAKPTPGASAQSFSAKTSFAGKKTSFQRKAV